MRLRVASIAILIGAAGTALSWLTLQPSLKALLDAVFKLGPVGSPTRTAVAQIQSLLPFYLALDLVVLTSLSYFILLITVVWPLAAAERSIDRLARLDLKVPWVEGGPLVARLQSALQRMTDALSTEQSKTRSQLLELQASHERLMRAQSELVASDRLATVGKLAAGVAHEVGNPLSGILGYLSLMRTRPASGPDPGELICRIEGEVQRIDSIVRSLLELGRPSRGRPGPVELGPLVESSARLLVSSPELQGVEVRQAVPPGLCALAEPGPLSQVVINLVLNGAQAMGGKGVLELAARAADDRVELTVRDHGPGLPPEVLARLFEPFFTTRAAGKGTGLGLAVSRHLIEAMGGQLLAENHPEGGALFTVKLPPLPKPAVTQ